MTTFSIIWQLACITGFSLTKCRITTLSIIKLSKIKLIIIALIITTLSTTVSIFSTECGWLFSHYVECRYAVCRGTKWLRFNVCHLLIFWRTNFKNLTQLVDQTIVFFVNNFFTFYSNKFDLDCLRIKLLCKYPTKKIAELKFVDTT